MNVCKSKKILLLHKVVFGSKNGNTVLLPKVHLDYLTDNSNTHLIDVFGLTFVNQKVRLDRINKFVAFV